MVKEMKICVIGGGSSYTPELMEGFIHKIRELPLREIVLCDIPEGERKLGIIEGLVKRMFLKAGLLTKISSSLERSSALDGADFVLTQFRVGGLDARSRDEKIPLEFGIIGQETTGPGGFAKALRTIPVILSICRDIEKYCPDAWLINFTNPSGMVTEAVLKHSAIRSIGLCNVPINMLHDAARRLECVPEKLWLRFAGLNHLSFITEAKLDGRDILSRLLEADSDPLVKNIAAISKSELFSRALGFIPSPYLQYFYYRKQMFEEEKHHLESGEGSRADAVRKVEKELFRKYADPELAEKPKELENRGGSRYSEAAVNLVESLALNKQDVQVVNARNNGAIDDLPADAVIETNCVIGSDGAKPLAYGSLPLSIRGLIQQVKGYEELAIEAAVTGDYGKALLALVNHPLVGDASLAGKLLDKILDVNREYLPNFSAQNGGNKY